MCQKYPAARHIFISLLGVWKGDEILSLVFDILLRHSRMDQGFAGVPNRVKYANHIGNYSSL